MVEILKEKFVTHLLTKPPEKIVSYWIMERVPHVFNDNLELYIDWKHALANKIKVDSASILIIGSSSVGISLNPNKNYRDFNNESDIDVAIISDYQGDCI